MRYARGSFLVIARMANFLVSASQSNKTFSTACFSNITVAALLRAMRPRVVSVTCGEASRLTLRLKISSGISFRPRQDNYSTRTDHRVNRENLNLNISSTYKKHRTAFGVT